MPARDDVPVDRLRHCLDSLDDPRAVERATALIAYAEGVPQSTIAEWYGRSRKTIYNWARRVTEGQVPESLTDADRPGRPQKLSVDERAQLRSALERSPEDSGFDASEWTPSLVGTYVRREFDVAYHRATCRRLLAEFTE